jgi:hypothetical protein
MYAETRILSDSIGVGWGEGMGDVAQRFLMVGRCLLGRSWVFLAEQWRGGRDWGLILSCFSVEGHLQVLSTHSSFIKYLLSSTYISDC